MGTLLRTVIRAGTYSVIRRLGLAKTIAVGVVALAALWLLTGNAAAATYTTTCPTPVGTDPSCDALAERLEVLVAELEAKPETDAEYDYSALLTAIEENTTGSGEPGEVTGVVELASPVELSEADRNRSDLIWWGTWAVVGLMLTLLIAPKLTGLLDVTRGM